MYIINLYNRNSFKILQNINLYTIKFNLVRFELSILCYD